MVPAPDLILSSSMWAKAVLPDTGLPLRELLSNPDAVIVKLDGGMDPRHIVVRITLSHSGAR